MRRFVISGDDSQDSLVRPQKRIPQASERLESLARAFMTTGSDQMKSRRHSRFICRYYMQLEVIVKQKRGEPELTVLKPVSMRES